MRRESEVRRALEHGQLRRLLGDDRDRLDGGRAGADHRDALALEVDAVMRPAAGEVDRALEVVHAVEFRRLGLRQAAGRHDVVAAGDGRAVVRREQPTLLRLIPGGAEHAGAEANVPAQIVTIGDEAEIAQDLRLGGIFLGPLPGGLEFGIERVAVVDGLDVAARARIAVPKPGAADIGCGIQRHGREARLAQAVKQVQSRKSGAHDGDVDRLGFTLSGFRRACLDHSV